MPHTSPLAARRAPPAHLLPDVPASTPPRANNTRQPHPRGSRPTPKPPRPFRDPRLPHDKNFPWTTEAKTVEELALRAGMGDLTAIAHAKHRFGRHAARQVATAAGYRTEAEWAMLGL
jgi:hypothetical protein